MLLILDQSSLDDVIGQPSYQTCLDFVHKKHKKAAADLRYFVRIGIIIKISSAVSSHWQCVDSVFHRADRRWKWICSCRPECLSVEVSSNISHHNHINSRQMDVGPEPIFPVGCRDAGRFPSNPPVLPWPPPREGCSKKNPQTQKDSLTWLECFTFSSDFDYFFTEVWHIDLAGIKPWCRSHSRGGA